MRNSTLFSFLFIFFGLHSLNAVAQTNIHYWDFNSGATLTAGNKWPSPIAATSTVNSGTVTHNFTNTEDFGGTTLDAAGFAVPTAGAAFCVVDALNNDKSFILNVPTTGYQNIKLSYATRGTSTGFANQVIDYSTDGTTYTNFTTITGRTNITFTLQTVDFTSITAANNNPNFKIRITVNGATSTGGNNRFDNIRVYANTVNATTASVTSGVNAAEPSSNGSFLITLTNAAPAGGVTVTYNLTGSATASTDYNDPQTGSITVAEGSTTATVNINVVNDNIPEPTKNITLTLLTANNGYSVVSTPATINLYDNDVASGVVGTLYNFNTCGAFISQGFKEYNVTGPQVWNCTKLGRTYTADPSTDSAIQINGFSGGPIINEDWLISPPFNLTGANNPMLRFFSKSQFAGNQLVLKVSTNYVPGTNPNTATWTNINGKFPAAGSNVWTVSDSIDLSAYTVPNVYIAWYYTSTSAIASQWSLDDIRITLGCTPPTTQATAINLTPAITSVNGSFAASSPASDGYLVIMSTTPTLNAIPQNGTAYAVDDVVGNGTVISIGNGTTFTATNLNPSTQYYYFVYAYSSAQTCYNTITPLSGNVTTTSPPVCTPPSAQATNFQATVTGSSINLTYTRGNGDNILIVARPNTSVSQNPIRGVNYTAGTQIGSGNTVIYNGPASSFSYTSLTQNTGYYFALYEYTNANYCYNLTPLTGNFTTSCITPVNVSSLNAVGGNASVNVSWTNPTASCFNEILVVVSNTTITGAGSDYTGTANTTYSGPNQVVYRGVGASVTVTGLTNSTTYYFKVFTKNGSTYSSGILTTATPYDPANGFLYLYGNLHSHSSYSDGNKEDLSKKPIDDYKFGRDANCMDFLGISEHNHAGAGMNIANYPKGFADANAVNLVPGPTGNSIVTLWGMEWGVISGGGHVLVYGFNDQLIGWEPGNYNIFVAKNDYASLFNTINGQPNAFGTLAHPNFSDFGNLAGTAYNALADNAIVGTAIESGPAFSTDTTYSNLPFPLADFEYYKTMLAKGYRLGAQVDGDNHYLTFGKQSTNRMVVLSTAKTREDLTTAIRNMRFYASNDCNARLDYKLNSTVMGGSLTSSGKPALTISLTDPDPLDLVDSLYIYAGKVGDAVVLDPIKRYSGVSSVTFSATDAENLQPDNTTYYYYTMIKQSDGNRVISSPIWYSRNDAALPVTLVTIKAAYIAVNNTTQLKWSTAQEINSKAFIIERSTDGGRTFTNIGSVNAGGTTSTPGQYQFTDLSPAIGTSLYRLKMLDMDDKYEYSTIISVNISDKPATNYYSFYPNPASQFTYISSASNESKMAIIQLVDATGRIVRHQVAGLNKNHPVKFTLAGASAGMYLIRIISDGSTTTNKIIIK